MDATCSVCIIVTGATHGCCIHCFKNQLELLQSISEGSELSLFYFWQMPSSPLQSARSQTQKQQRESSRFSKLNALCKVQIAKTAKTARREENKLCRIFSTWTKEKWANLSKPGVQNQSIQQRHFILDQSGRAFLRGRLLAWPKRHR